MKSDLEVPLLAIAGVFTMEVFDSWFGRLFTAALFIVAVIRIIQWLKAWNYPKQKRKEEHQQYLQTQEKRAEEHEEHLQSKKEHDLRIKLLEKDLQEKERKEQEERERKQVEEKKKEGSRNRKGAKKDREDEN